MTFTIPCGCKIGVRVIQFCPTHATAPQMLEALEATQKLLNAIYADDVIGSKELDEVYGKNLQALAAAKREDNG